MCFGKVYPNNPDIGDSVRRAPSQIESHVDIDSLTEAPPGGDTFDAVLDVLLADVERLYVLMYSSEAYEEEWSRAAYHNPLFSPVSDAMAIAGDGATAEAVFPGAFTWAAWYFRCIVRETGELTLEDAVPRMKSLAIHGARLKGRDRLVQGAWADIVVFDPERFRDPRRGSCTCWSMVGSRAGMARLPASEAGPCFSVVRYRH